MSLRKEVCSLLLLMVLGASFESTESGTNICRKGEELPCERSLQCIDKSRWCDGNIDCSDGSDERYCDKSGPYYYQEGSSTNCPNNIYFGCKDGQCVPLVAICDGYSNCLDASDENEELCSISGIIKNNKYIGLKTRLMNFLERQKNSNQTVNKWGSDLPRIAIALYLADTSIFQTSARNSNAYQDIVYEISLQLLSKNKASEKLSTHQLAMHINALIITCQNPSNFYGTDVVAELRTRVDRANYTNPFTILTLCKAGAKMTETDVDKVISAFGAQYIQPWTDMQALAVMAMVCLRTKPELRDDDDYVWMISELKKKQHSNGTVDNLSSTALVLQALIATNNSQNFDNRRAMEFILSEEGRLRFSVTDAYFILPVLQYRSFLDISNSHCTNKEMKDSKIGQLKSNELIQIQYSMFIGDGIDYARTWKVKVQANSTFYRILEEIATVEPENKVTYKVVDGKPYVSELKNRINNADMDEFWFVCKRKLGEDNEPKILDMSPVEVYVKEDEEYILWYRTGAWAK